MKTYLILPLLLLFACTTNPTTTTIAEEDINAVQQLLANQIKAWNNGNHAAFMNGYWNSDSLRFCGRNGTSYGWQQTLEMYQKSFPNRDDMGVLSFKIDTIITSRAPYITVDGQWKILRSDTIGGQFVLLFAQKNNEWKIIEDHTW